MSGPPSELSIRTLGVGAVLGALFSAVSMYAGTKTGIIDGGNIPAALLGFGALAALGGRRPSARDGNIVQTVSSSAAIMTITSGLVGPLAALTMTGTTYSPLATIVWSIALGVLGSLMAIPLRDAYIVRDELPFPSGAATADVFDTVYSGAVSAAMHLRILLGAAGFAGVVTLLQVALDWLPEVYVLPLSVGAIPAAAIELGISWSPLLAGIGIFAGGATAIALLVGAVLAWVVIAPLLVAAGIAQPEYGSLWGWLLWVGTGLMLGGTMGSVVAAWRGVRNSLHDVRAIQPTAPLRFARDPSSDLRFGRGYIVALAGTAIGVVVLAYVVFGVHPIITLLALGLSVVLNAAAARANGETDNTPAGPLGGFAQIVVGATAPGGVTAPLTAGGVVNGALMHSAMQLQNWRTGYLIKAAPRPQLVAQLVGVVVGSITCLVAFELIRRTYGLGTEAMPAPAAVSWRATAEVVQHGVSAMPAHAPLAAAIAFGVGIVLALAQTRKQFLPSPVAMGMAFILPPSIPITIGVAGVVWWGVARKRPAWTGAYGVALASGLIAGGAVGGLFNAFLILVGVVQP